MHIPKRIELTHLGESLMVRSRCVSLSLVAFLTFAFVEAPYASAQASASASAVSSTKQTRKAQRKAARAKKNAELSALRKNGFSPGGDQENYPSNIQSAERKLQASKNGASTPNAASAP